METVPSSFTGILIRLGEDENIYIVVFRELELTDALVKGPIFGTSFMSFKVMGVPFVPSMKLYTAPIWE